MGFSGKVMGDNAYLTEQHIQPFASSSHSSTSWPFWLIVNAFSISAALDE